MWLDLSWYYNAKGWVKKRRKAILWAAAVTGGGVCVYYAASWYRVGMKMRDEEASRLAVLHKEAEERVEAQLQYHFESIQQISDSTTLPSVLPHLRDRLFSLVDLSGLTERLVAGKGDPQALSHQEKMQLWYRLKILSFTRTMSAMSAVGLLDLFVRIQLNILGRRMYIDTARDLSATEGQDLEGNLYISCQHRFLAFAEFLPHVGLDRLVKDIQFAVEKIMKSIPLKQPFDSYGLRDLFSQILASFMSQQLEWEMYVLPTDDILSDDLEATVTEADAEYSSKVRFMSTDDRHDFNTLMAETRAIISSAEFHSALEAVFDVMLNEAMAKYEEGFFGSSTRGIPLAKLLPYVANLASSFLEHAENNAFILAVASHPKVQSFCAMVYASSAPEI
ncbi:hypothetical protein O6H91_03G078900 [Diphasiastrum complanatum]|uniref:Uncharacterized protein n=1 Tax=Diphasiastrum complanatum TaxID=34168 RepID=A0ACC2E8F3_DIPCM|nr:hypothetical protein O6H91_Y240300 [Diphasiastrum complanatum]KAJ7562655.1 hypothetical protein O6H91_03G078900 [Diphasiastrum complanatum]